MAEAVASADLEANRRPGDFGFIVRLESPIDYSTFHSYSCGGVGHMSRDCVQGSKCYNCSGVVSNFHSGHSEALAY